MKLRFNNMFAFLFRHLTLSPGDPGSPSENGATWNLNKYFPIILWRSVSQDP